MAAIKSLLAAHPDEVDAFFTIGALLVLLAVAAVLVEGWCRWRGEATHDRDGYRDVALRHDQSTRQAARVARRPLRPAVPPEAISPSVDRGDAA